MKRRGYHHAEKWMPVYYDVLDEDLRAIDIGENEAAARREIAACGHLTASVASFTWPEVYACFGWEGGFATYSRNKTEYGGW